MHTSARPFVTAGIVLVGAGMIAVQSPIAPREVSVPHIAHQSVQLAAAPSPIEFYTEVTTHALRNSGEIVSMYLSHPISAAVGLAGLVFVPLSWPVTATIAASAVINGIGAALVAIYDVVEAVLSLNVVDLVNAIIDIPARIADGVLNGGYPMGTFLDAGLLTADPPLGERVPGLAIWPAVVGFLVTGGLFGLSAPAEEAAPATEATAAADAAEVSVVSNDDLSDESPEIADSEQTPADDPVAGIPAVDEDAVVTEEHDEESPAIADERTDAGDALPDNDIEDGELQDNDKEAVDSEDDDVHDDELQDDAVQVDDVQVDDDAEAGASQAAEV